VHPAYSYTIPRRGLGPCGIGVCDSNSALAIQWNRRINNNLSNNKNNNNNIVSTRLQMSYQPSPPTPQEDETSTPSNDDPKAATTESSRRSRRSSKDEEKEPTLYEILNASPDATRSELKKQYATLARVSHPDAQKNDETIDFQQIAEAWNTLGNPQSRRRYDRQLKAKAWGEAAQRLTNERLEQVAPVASSFMDNLAVPFLKRTSATTFAVGKAIATGLAATKEVANSVSSKNGVAETSSSVKISKNGVAAETAAKEKSDNIQIEKNSASTTTEAVETADNQTTEINGATTTPTIPISIPIPVQKNSTTTDDTSITTDDTDVDAADADTPDYQLNEKSLELQEL
jgi:curved DNA-binding protein CbpA